jgi:RimJ/RimL family protein N-acetyltransferase
MLPMGVVPYALWGNLTRTPSSGSFAVEITRMTLIEIPTLTTARLRLRAFCVRDLDALAAMRANPEVVRYLGSGRTSTATEVWQMMAMFLGQWTLRGYGVWACDKVDDAAFVGYVGIFHPLDWLEPELIYSLDQPFWRQGFATEAAATARDWLFEHFPLARAASFIRPDNQASKRVAERLGAVYERTFERRGSDYEHWTHCRTDSHPLSVPS